MSQPATTTAPPRTTTTQVVVRQQTAAAVPQARFDPGQPVGYPAAPTYGAPLYVSQALPPLKYVPPAEGDPDNTPRLPDFSGGWIDLDGAYPGDNKFKPTRVVEVTPKLPFWPGQRINENPYGHGLRGAIAEYVAKASPDAIDPRHLTYAYGWSRLAHAAPVYVAHPGFGVGVALYWWDSVIPVMAGLPPTRVYAVMKLTPLPVTAVGDRFVGKYYKVPAAWCKPMKAAISQFPTASSPDTYNVVFAVDTGEEWRIPLDVVRKMYRERQMRAISAAVNALCRDYPWLENMFAFVPSQPPQAVVRAIADYARGVQVYQAALGGQGGAVVSTVPGLMPSGMPGATMAVRRPAATAATASSADEEQEEGEEEETTPATKNAAATINLSSCNVVQLRPWE